MNISVPPPSVMVRSDDVILVGEDVVVYDSGCELVSRQCSSEN